VSQIPTREVGDLPADFVLLDVREPHEWEAGHAPQALHIPMGQLPDRLGELQTDQELIVVCHVGGRSARSTAWLLSQGVDCSNLAGGMLAWAAAGRPLVSETGAPPVVD